MAKGKNIIKVNFEGVEAFKTVPEGDYKITIDEVLKEIGSGSGEPYLAWTFAIAEGKFKGQKLFYNTSLQPKALWNLRGVLEAFGLEVPDGVMELDLAELNDHDGEAGCTVEHETSGTYKGKARIMDVFDADNVKEGVDPDDKAPGGDEAEVTREDILAMDEDELAELVKDNDLEVELDDLPKLSAKRKAVADAVEALQGEGGGEGIEKPSEDDVLAMDEDELTEVIKEHDLDLDLDDHPTIKKKRAAVVEALEGAGGGGEDAVTEEAILEMGKEELKAFVAEHKLKKVKLEGTTSKWRREVVKAAKAAGLIEDAE